MSLVWDEADFISCLETTPETDAYGTVHKFVVADGELSLEILVWQYHGDVSIELSRAGTEKPLFELLLFDCAGVRAVKDDAGERLEFAPAKAFGSRYDGQSPAPFGISVSVKPAIAIRMFSHDA